MTVYMPHKDTLFLLARVQRELIARYNEGRQARDYLYPAYPLYAFSPDGDLPGTVTDCAVLAPVAEGCEWYFPFELRTAEGSVRRLKIVFATGRTEIKRDAPKDTPFPLRPRVWRKGDAVIENNGWQIFNTVWCRLSR